MVAHTARSAFQPVAADGAVDETYLVELDGKPIELRVRYREVVDTSNTDDPSAGIGCSAATSGARGLAAGGAAGALSLLVGLAALVQRRRRAER